MRADASRDLALDRKRHRATPVNSLALRMDSETQFRDVVLQTGIRSQK